MVDITLTEGEALVVDYEVLNRGSATGTQDIDLTVGGTTEDTESGVTVDPGETRRGVLAWITENGDAGSYSVCVETDDRTDCIDVDVNS